MVILTSFLIEQREELRLSKLAYDKDLEAIYRSDHDTNAQRVCFLLFVSYIDKRFQYNT
jgi:hypothetical protein